MTRSQLPQAVQAVIGAQSLEIVGWLPAALTNGSRGHWSVHQKKLKAAQVMVWAAARQAGWTGVYGRARLTVTLVFGQQRRRDTDNLYARVKGLVDGVVRGGWIRDDSTDCLELIVKAEVSKEWNGTRLLLESVSPEQFHEQIYVR